MDNRMKEIRRILTGFISYEMNGAVIVAAKNIYEMQGTEFFHGSDCARMFGLHTMKRRYVFHGNVQSLYEKCVKSFADLGRRVYLTEAPDALAMLCRPLVGSPAVVTLEGEGHALELNVYIARSPLCLVYGRRIMKRIDEALPIELKELVIQPQPKPEEQSEAEGPSRGKWHRIRKKSKEKHDKEND